MAVYENSPGVVFSREQTAQLAFQAGARGDDLIFLTGIPQGESSYRPGVHRTDSPRGNLTGDFGLWQINYIHFARLRQRGIINHPTDLFDPATNARAALDVLRHQGREAWVAYDGSMGGNDSINWAAARTAVQNAATQGILGADPHAGAGAAATAAGGGGPVVLPPDARLVAVGSGDPWALFNIGPNLWIGYSHVGAENLNRPIERLSAAQRNAKYGNFVRGGHAAEVSGIAATFGSFQKYWNATLDSVISASNPGRNNPGVLRVFAEYAARQDMELSELENKLQATQYFQTRTQAELEWNDFSEAEREKRRGDIESRMVNSWRQFAGIEAAQVSAKKIEDLASGRVTFNEWIETVVKPRSATMDESPWARELRSEQEAKRERGIDIENTTARVRDALERYGLRWHTESITDWAKALVEKRRSDDDLVQTLERGAEALYPGLGPLNGSDVMTLAAPWIETYERVLERRGSPFTPEIRQALAAGEQVWDMEQRLTKSDKWLTTRNADERMHDFGSQIDEMWGL